MHKLSMLLFFLTTTIVSTYSQKKVIIKAGTIVPIQSVSTVKAADVVIDQTVDFKVTSDIKIDDVVAIPAGTLVKGIVVEAKKSTIAGTKGRLTIKVNSLSLGGGEQVFFTDSFIRRYGKNRTPVAVITSLFCWPLIFIPGTKAVMPAGYETQATVAANTAIVI